MFFSSYPHSKRPLFLPCSQASSWLFLPAASSEAMTGFLQSEQVNAWRGPLAQVVCSFVAAGLTRWWWWRKNEKNATCVFRVGFAWNILDSGRTLLGWITSLNSEAALHFSTLATPGDLSSSRWWNCVCLVSHRRVPTRVASSPNGVATFKGQWLLHDTVHLFSHRVLSNEKMVASTSPTVTACFLVPTKRFPTWSSFRGCLDVGASTWQDSISPRALTSIGWTGRAGIHFRLMTFCIKTLLLEVCQAFPVIPQSTQPSENLLRFSMTIRGQRCYRSLV